MNCPAPVSLPVLPPFTFTCDDSAMLAWPEFTRVDTWIGLARAVALFGRLREETPERKRVIVRGLLAGEPDEVENRAPTWAWSLTTEQAECIEAWGWMELELAADVTGLDREFCLDDARCALYIMRCRGEGESLSVAVDEIACTTPLSSPAPERIERARMLHVHVNEFSC